MSNRFLKSQLLSIPLIAMLSTNIQTAVASDPAAEEIFGAIGKVPTNKVILSEPMAIDKLKDLSTDNVTTVKYLYECIKTVASNFYYLGQLYINDGENQTNLSKIQYDAIRNSNVQVDWVLKNVKELQTSEDDTINLDAILDEFTIHMAHSFEQLVSRSPDSYISRFMQVLISLNHKLIDVDNERFKTPTEEKECLSEFIYTAKKAIEELGAVSTLKERPAILMLSLMLNGIGQSKDVATPINTLPMEVTNDAATQMYDGQHIIDGVKLAIKALQQGAEEALKTIPEQELEKTLLVSTELSKEMLAKDVYRSIEQDYNIQPQDIKKVNEEIANAVANQNYINATPTSIINNIFNKINFNNIFQDYISANDAADLLAAHTEDILDHIKKIASQGTQISYNKYYKVISDQLCGYTNKLRDKDRIVKALLDLIDTQIAQSLIPIDDLKYEAPQEQDEIDRDTEISTNLALTLKTNNIIFNRDDLVTSNLLNTIYNAGKLQYENFEQIQGTTIFNDQNIALATLEQKINRYNALTKEQKWLATYEILNGFMSQECGDDYKNKPYWQQMSDYDKRKYEQQMVKQKKYDEYKNTMAWMLGVTNRKTNTADDENERKKLGKFLSETFITHATTKATVQEKLGGAREVSEDEQNRALRILNDIKAIVLEHTKSTEKYAKSRPATREKLEAESTLFASTMCSKIESDGTEAFNDFRIGGRPVILLATPKSRENDASIKRYVETSSSIIITLRCEVVDDNDIEDGAIKESAMNRYIAHDLYSEENIESALIDALGSSLYFGTLRNTTVGQTEQGEKMIDDMQNEVKQRGKVRRNSKGKTPKENVITITMEGDKGNKDNEEEITGGNTHFGANPNPQGDKPSGLGNGTKPKEKPKKNVITLNLNNNEPPEIELENKIVTTKKLTDFLTGKKKEFGVNDTTHDNDLVSDIIEAMIIKDGNLLTKYDSLDMDVKKLTETIDNITKTKSLMIGHDQIDFDMIKLANYIIKAKDNDLDAKPGILFSRSGGKITTKLENIQVITPPHADTPLKRTVITLLAGDGSHVRKVTEKKYKEEKHGSSKVYVEDTVTPKAVTGTISEYTQVMRLGDEKVNLMKLIYLIKDKIEYKKMLKEKTNEKGDLIINTDTGAPEIETINVAQLNNIILTDMGDHVITEADVQTAEGEINADLKKKDIKGLEALILKDITLINKKAPEEKATEEVTKRLAKITNEQQLRLYLREIDTKKTQLTSGDKDAIFMAAVKYKIKVDQYAKQLKLEGVALCDLVLAEDYLKTGNLEEGTVKINDNGSLMTSAEIIKEKKNIIKGYQGWLKQLAEVNINNGKRESSDAEIEAYIKRLKATKYLDDCLDNIIADHQILGLTRAGNNLKASNETVCAVKDLLEELKNAQHDGGAIVAYDGQYFRYDDVDDVDKKATIEKALGETKKSGNDDNKYIADITTIYKMVKNANLNTSYVDMLNKKIYDNMLDNNLKLTPQMKQANAIILDGDKFTELPPETVTKVGDPMTKNDHIKKAEASDIQQERQPIELTMGNKNQGLQFIRELRRDGQLLPAGVDASKIKYEVVGNEKTSKTIQVTYDGKPVIIMTTSNTGQPASEFKDDIKDILDSITDDIKKNVTPGKPMKDVLRKKFINAVKRDGRPIYTK